MHKLSSLYIQAAKLAISDLWFVIQNERVRPHNQKHELEVDGVW